MFTCTCESNAAAAAKLLLRVAQELPYAVDDATKAVTEKIEEAGLKILEELYWVPKRGYVATGRGYLGRRTDNPEWTRIGALRAAESITPLFGEGYLISTVGGMAYSEIFDVAGGGSIEKDPEDYAEWIYYTHPVSSRWRERGYNEVKSQLPQVFETTMKKSVATGLLRND